MKKAHGPHTPTSVPRRATDDPLGVSDIRSDVTDGWQQEPFQSGFTA